jgi:sec-independent protein translocase protein TatC
MRVADHIRELQKRLVVSVIILAIAGVGIYLLYEPLLALLRSPLNAPLYYSNPAGSFAFVMKICLTGGLAVAIPVIVYNVIMFVRPAFETHISLKRVYLTCLFSAILAFAGAAFAFTLIIPGALRFFAGFQVEGLSALISADSYLNFVTSAITTFILVFQLPLLISFIDRIKPLTPKKLLGMEKWVVLGSLGISVLVPFSFDLTTTLLIALPIIVLYNLSVIMIVMHHANLARKARRAERALHQVSRIPSSSLSLTDLSFESLVGETAAPEITALIAEPVPTTTQYTYTAPRVVTQPTAAVMDIKRRSEQPEKVTPAAWVHYVHKQIPLDPRARIISDIGTRRQVTN